MDDGSTRDYLLAVGTVDCPTGLETQLTLYRGLKGRYA